MPRCYLIVVSQGSSLDQGSNNWSYFTLTEQFAIPEADVHLGFEMHSHWLLALNERNKKIEYRVVVTDESGEVLQRTPVNSFKTEKARMRVRSFGVPIPAFGQLFLWAEWRIAKGKWHRSKAFWPLEVLQAEIRPVEGTGK